MSVLTILETGIKKLGWTKEFGMAFGKYATF